MRKFEEVFRGFENAPETHCDRKIASRIASWATRDDLKAIEIKNTLDEIVYSSLASGFVVNVLDASLGHQAAFSCQYRPSQ